MIRFYPDEEWKRIEIGENTMKFKYAISNYGRIISYTDDVSNGRILKGGNIKGYPVLPLKISGKRKTFYIHKLVGEYFLKKNSDAEKYVIHLDYNKQNNYYRNLQWASKQEMENHQNSNPLVLASREIQKNKKPQVGMKLTSTDVIRIKKKLYDPNRKTRLKLIAKEFGISEMQLYRIKSGENWSHIKIPEENR